MGQTHFLTAPAEVYFSYRLLSRAKGHLQSVAAAHVFLLNHPWEVQVRSHPSPRLYQVLRTVYRAEPTCSVEHSAGGWQLPRCNPPSHRMSWQPGARSTVPDSCATPEPHAAGGGKSSIRGSVLSRFPCVKPLGQRAPAAPPVSPRCQGMCWPCSGGNRCCALLMPLETAGREQQHQARHTDRSRCLTARGLCPAPGTAVEGMWPPPGSCRASPKAQG